MDHYQHPNAVVESTHIGKNTRIWAFAHILPGAVIGEDCNICDHTFVENRVVIGNRVTVKCGVQLWDGVTIEDDVFIGPNATFTNDPKPRSKQHLDHYPQTFVRQGASIGANATILPGVVIGRHAMVGAGAVVTNNVPPYAVVVGNPARIVGYETTHEQTPTGSTETSTQPEPIKVKGVRIIQLPYIVDMRGELSVMEFEKDLPFSPRRYFTVFNVPSKEVRGEHAHKTLHQFLICLKGSCSVVADDGENRTDIRLSRPNVGIYIPPMIWTVQYNYSPDAVMLVLASDFYQPEDYIRDYEEFMQMMNSV